MTTKLTTSEKISLLQHHGSAIESAFGGIAGPDRDELIEHANRALAIIKSIPKIEFSIPQ